MENRILAKDTKDNTGKVILVKGWVRTRRDHGKLIFLDLKDRSGILQIVVNEKVSQNAYKVAQSLRSEDVIAVEGRVNKRPDHLINTKIISGSVELEASDINILSKADTLPFDMGTEFLNLELPTLLDYRSLTLRHPSVTAIFKVQAAIVEAFREIAKELECMEIFVPTIVASATEGGADVFMITYYQHKAYLAQSPQLYKQMLVPIFERVFTIAHAYRAEPSVTTRHLSEITQIDMEMGFLEFEQLLDILEYVGTSMLTKASKSCSEVLELYKVDFPLVAKKTPRLTLKESQDIISKRTGRDLTKELDLNPEDEVEICNWAKEVHKSDFVTITHFPLSKKPFYTKADPKNPKLSLSYDLLFRGREILSGSQRVNDYDELVDAIKKRGLNESSFNMYLQAFKYGMPKEGGFSFGLERLTQQLLKLPNIREASLYPRDMERVDERFSISEAKKKKA